jgi:hypothetical protein
MQNGRELWISWIYFPMENLVDRVHVAWIGWRGQKGVAALEEDELDEAVLEGVTPQAPRA